MPKTIVLQSHRQPLLEEWLKVCIDSVKHWAELNTYDYECIGDELFEYLSTEVIEKTKSQKVIATDLARLKVLKEYFLKGYDTVVWCDADFIIFSPEKFNLLNETFAVGREVWIQENDKNSKNLTAYIKVHNAFMMFKKGNSFLDFYHDAAERLLIKNKGQMSPQFIGPKLLTAIHNIVQCPVQETAGMLSPLVIKDIAKGGGQALDLFKKKSPSNIFAANLCSSLFERGEFNAEIIEKCLGVLSSQPEVLATN